MYGYRRALLSRCTVSLPNAITAVGAPSHFHDARRDADTQRASNISPDLRASSCASRARYSKRRLVAANDVKMCIVLLYDVMCSSCAMPDRSGGALGQGCLFISPQNPISVLVEAMEAFALPCLPALLTAQPSHCLSLDRTLTDSGARDSSQAPRIHFSISSSCLVSPFAVVFSSPSPSSRLAGPPQSVRSCLIANHSMTTLLLDCMPGDDGGLQQIFYVEVFNTLLQEYQANLSSLERPNFLIENLSPGTKFNLIIYSANTRGRSTQLTLSAATLGPPERQTSPSEFDVDEDALHVARDQLVAL